MRTAMVVCLADSVEEEVFLQKVPPCKPIVNIDGGPCCVVDHIFSYAEVGGDPLIEEP